MAVRAEKGPLPHAGEVTRGGCVQFRFNNANTSDQHKDSVLIIFDLCNHTGAGVIYQVFYADKDHCITIPSIPTGKYYVTIQCLGVHRDRLEKRLQIRKTKKNQKVNITLADTEEYSKDKVVIPAFHPNFANLARMKNR